MTIIKQETAIAIGPVNSLNELWCVYEHHMLFDPTQPPVLVYIMPCKLSEVFDLRDGRNNSDWCALAANNYPLMISIVATTTTQSEAYNLANQRVKALLVAPRCNLHGYNLRGVNRVLISNTGVEYQNQAEAARSLGCSQSAISQHLNGRLDNVKGHKLTYKVRP